MGNNTNLQDLFGSQKLEKGLIQQEIKTAYQPVIKYGIVLSFESVDGIYLVKLSDCEDVATTFTAILEEHPNMKITPPVAVGNLCICTKAPFDIGDLFFKGAVASGVKKGGNLSNFTCRPVKTTTSAPALKPSMELGTYTMTPTAATSPSGAVVGVPPENTFFLTGFLNGGE